jgi:hypothetical protein
MDPLRRSCTTIRIDSHECEFFQKSPNSPPINILYDGRIAELFVPYHPGAPRLFDIWANYSPLVLTPAHRPPPPRVADLIADNKICKEIRTYLAWMDGARVRYGKEVVYFCGTECW